MAVRLRIITLVLALFVVLIAAVPAFAAPNATVDAVVFDPVACTLSVTFTVEDAGQYAVTVFDDGALLVGYEANYAVGTTNLVVFTIGGPDGSPGVAVATRESINAPGAYDFVNDEFWSDPEGIDCQTRGFVFGVLLNEPEAAAGSQPPCPNPLPAGAVVRNVPAGALAYFEPSLDAYTGFNLPAGTWYTTDTEGDFTQVWIACQANSIWIPTANIAG